MEIEPAAEAVRNSRKLNPKERSVTIGNKELKALETKLKDAKEDVDDIMASDWKKDFGQALDKAFSNEEVWGVSKALNKLKHTKEAKKLKTQQMEMEK